MPSSGVSCSVSFWKSRVTAAERLGTRALTRQPLIGQPSSGGLYRPSGSGHRHV